MLIENNILRYTWLCSRADVLWIPKSVELTLNFIVGYSIDLLEVKFIVTGYPLLWFSVSILVCVFTSEDLYVCLLLAEHGDGDFCTRHLTAVSQATAMIQTMMMSGMAHV